MSIYKLDKVAIVEIGKRLTIYNDYVALLVTCKRIACFLRENLKKFLREQTTPLITLQYFVWAKDKTKDTVFLDSYRKEKSMITKHTIILIRWKGKYSTGWYDRSGNFRRINIRSSFLDTNVPGEQLYYLYLYSEKDVNISTCIDFKDNIVYCNQRNVMFKDKLCLVEFAKEIEYIAKHREEIELRWNYKDEGEIRI